MNKPPTNDLILGYCTNVHAGPTYAQTLANLDRYAVRVRERLNPDAPMGVGLWLAAPAARELVSSNKTREFRDWLAERNLQPFTLNGFPYGDFHEPVVKHKVYHPTWADRERLDYTLDLIAILNDLLPPGAEGSISTLPLGWRTDFADRATIERAADQLIQIAEHLAKLERETGRLIHIDLEPEPGCFLDTSQDVVSLFEQHLLPRRRADDILRHLRVCHDVCHAAVMFESQQEMFDRYQRAGIRIGKVQLSSAVRLAGNNMDSAQYAASLEQLRTFAEDRYLHQTVVRREGSPAMFFEDLPAALNDPRTAAPGAQWCVHFHVPLFIEQFGELETTEREVKDCLDLLKDSPTVRHYEVETYAWSVLPGDLQYANLAEGIAREMAWITNLVAASTPNAH